MKNNLEELMKTLETIRKEKYPEIPEEVIREIVEIQFKNQDNPTKRQGDTQRVILKYADQIKGEE